jgi:cysteine desulfurase
MNLKTMDTSLSSTLGVAVGIFGLFVGWQLERTRRIRRLHHSSGIGSRHAAALLKPNAGCIYLDYNATSPIFPEVSAAVIPFVTNCFGNPSSPHVFAAPCREAIAKSRWAVGILVNAPSSEKTIYFTSCGSESDNRAVDIALHHFDTRHNSHPYREGKGKAADATITPRVVTCKIEHPAILLYLEHLHRLQQIDLVVLPVNAEGFVSPSDIEANLTINTALVTIMHSNNEVGSIQPIAEISKRIREFNLKHAANILFHSDAAQSLGKVKVDVQALGVDMLTIVGHKFGAPKGVAALYVSESVRWSGAPMLIGGGQERGMRAGEFE